MKTLHALLVGIDKYHPDSKVRNLTGCKNDVENISTFLADNYAPLSPQLFKLINEDATRENILKTFHTHLIEKAVAGDTVLFFYSGHGSTERMPDYFKKQGTEKQNETLVCYDSRLEGHFDLADKELAVLISRIAEDVHILVVSDSCHSGSITRSINNEVNLGRQKYERGRGDDFVRDITTYLLEGDQYYQKMVF